MADPTNYDPSNSYESGFLAALRSGESGGQTNPYSVGYGGTDLSNAPTGAYGFPIWLGSSTSAGSTHAAGAYQFEPGTWSQLASKYGFNFSNPSDQDAAAWTLAEQRYSANTNGGDLLSAIKSGDWSSIQSALGSTWSSIGSDFGDKVKSGIGAELAPGPTNPSGTPSFWSDPTGALSSYFVRGSMIFVGALILLIALWALLSHQGALPSLSHA